jgi:hypothetical protein
MKLHSDIITQEGFDHEKTKYSTSHEISVRDKSLQA